MNKPNKNFDLFDKENIDYSNINQEIEIRHRGELLEVITISSDDYEIVPDVELDMNGNFKNLLSYSLIKKNKK